MLNVNDSELGDVNGLCSRKYRNITTARVVDSKWSRQELESYSMQCGESGSGWASGDRRAAEAERDRRRNYRGEASAGKQGGQNEKR